MHPSVVSVLLAAFIVGWASGAAAQAPGAETVTTSPTIREPVVYDGRSFIVAVHYELAQAWAGNNHVDVTVTIEAVGLRALNLIGCDKCGSDSPVFAGVTGPALVDPGTPAANDVWKRVYRLVAAIKPDIEPREYDLTLRFAGSNVAPGSSAADASLTVPFYVGVRKNGNLKVEEPSGTKPEACTSGRRCQFTLTLNNGFRDYEAQLRKLVVGSEPKTLVSRVVSVRGAGTTAEPTSADGPLTVRFSPPLIVGPAQNEDLTVDVEMSGMSAAALMSGFGDDQRVTFSFTYDDGRGRVISDYRHRRPVQLQPSFAASALCVTFGIAAGVFLMSVWKLLRYEGSLWHKVGLVVTTVIIGLIVSIFAVQGELNITAFKVRASYDKPMVLFMLSLVATVIGTPLLKGYFQLDKKPGNATPAGSPATTGRKR